MPEKKGPPLTRAEVFGESVLEAMRKDVESCEKFDELFPFIANNPIIVFEGAGGGGINVAMKYLTKLQDIHAPHCKLNAHKQIFRTTGQ